MTDVRSLARKTGHLILQGGTLAGPLALLALPKCPLCLLPLLAAAGVAVAPGPALQIVTLAVALAWAGLMFALSPSAGVLGAASAAAALLAAGKLLDLPVLLWLGMAAMLAVAGGVAARRACRRTCHEPGEEERAPS